MSCADCVGTAATLERGDGCCGLLFDSGRQTGTPRGAAITGVCHHGCAISRSARQRAEAGRRQRQRQKAQPDTDQARAERPAGLGVLTFSRQLQPVCLPLSFVPAGSQRNATCAVAAETVMAAEGGGPEWREEGEEMSEERWDARGERDERQEMREERQ